MLQILTENRYAASKTAAEKAVWDFAENERPQFTINAILPPMILGEPLHKSHAEVFAAYIRLLVQGDTAFLSSMPASKSPFPIPTSPSQLRC